MPELPEVNTVMKDFRKTALHLKIVKVTVHDDKIIRNVDRQEFAEKLCGQNFVDTYRQGKYFFAALSNRLEVLFHLGMTGDLVYYFDAADQPKYERFSMQFENGMILGYDDLRKFSNIRLLQDRSRFIQSIQLGPDALTITPEDFVRAFRDKSTSVKLVMMDQQLMAGIGNLYADEICFQARIHPASVAGLLKSKHLNKLHHFTHQILREACERDAYYKVYPDDWFWKWRDDKIKHLEGKGPIDKMKIGGRTTYFIRGYQELITN